MKEGFADRVRRAVQSIKEESSPGLQGSCGVGIILGSGLSAYADQFPGSEIPYSAIQGFPIPTVEGHRGTLKLGKQAALLSGRFHYYEGYSMDDVVLPIFLLHGLGVRTLIVTNAAGGINRAFKPGELVLISDHINLMGDHPLRGPNPESLGPRFPDMSEAYARPLRALARKAADRELKEGIYVAFLGPSYETPAEIRLAESIGADLVGMSTVPEVIAANYLGIQVLGISCVTNMAAGILEQPLSHKEVVETGNRVQPIFTGLLNSVLELLRSDEY